jgi:predicted MPP superfamily phosphohydrolase
MVVNVASDCRPIVCDLNRRHFLGAAVSGVALGSRLALAEPARRPEFTFALATDTHLGRQTGDDKRLEQLVGEINRSEAQFTLFCGDLVDNGQAEGKEKQYPLWKEVVKGLKKDYFAVPGNHDPDSLFLKHIAEKTDFVFEHKGFRFVCFRNAEPNPGHDGIVTPEQIKWLEARLAEARQKDQRVVLASHVAYHENKHPDVGWYVKKGREEFGKLLTANKHVVASLTGHFHCGLRGWGDTAGIHEVVLPSASWNADRGLGAAQGYSLREFRAGWVLAEMFSDQLVLRYCPFGVEATASKELTLPA